MSTSKDTKPKTQRGGAREGAGRKTKDGSKQLEARLEGRLTKQQRETFDRLGGMPWLRQLLDQKAESPA